jgi:hypothetical protein
MVVNLTHGDRGFIAYCLVWNFRLDRCPLTIPCGLRRREHERASRWDCFDPFGDSADPLGAFGQSNENYVDALLIGYSLSLSNCGLSVGF